MVPPAEPVHTTPAENHPKVELGDDTVARVLSGLEPVDQSTSFAHEPTARLPMLPAEPPPSAPAGKRRAAKGAPRRGSLVKRMPSAPVLVGIAALAVSIGGTIGVSGATSPTASHTSFGPPSVLTGTSAVGHAGSRAPLVSRDSDRQAQADAAQTDLTAAANGLAQQHNDALAALAKKAQAQSDKLKANLWITPITPGAYHLTAGFGQVSGLWSSFHTGLDFAAPTGTPIRAIADGVITFTAYDGSYGNKTVELLPDGTEIWYAHQNAFGTTVGAHVRQGETIGYVGSTGNTTGPHVHIEVRPGGGDPVDPFPAFQQHGITP